MITNNLKQTPNFSFEGKNGKFAFFWEKGKGVNLRKGLEENPPFLFLVTPSSNFWGKIFGFWGKGFWDNLSRSGRSFWL
ncbi:MAG: hypothetical protein CM15mP4_1670 [Candidatus Neomarinimicrobiota bacterium]|nr:MAG: hypothetical protein CM15mP4_1670 [Candidatus Neomarinimicrobiota bacterium]